MTSTTVTQRSTPSFPTLPSALLAILGGIALFLVIVSAFVTGYQVKYAGQIFPGVAVAGIDLSGKTTEQAAALLSQNIHYPDTGSIVFQEKDSHWVATPAELGLQLDAKTSAWAAYAVGRQGDPITRLFDQFQSWYSGVSLSPLLLYDERAALTFLEQIADQIYLPTIEATLEINGTDVITHQGQTGHSLNIPSTMEPLEAQLRSASDGLIPLNVVDNAPLISDTSEQAETARRILSEPLTLILPDAGEGDPNPLVISPEQLAQMLLIERVQTPDGAEYQVGLDASSLRPILDDLSPKLTRYPQNARVIFNDDTHQLEVIQSAVIGRELDVEGTIKQINERLVDGEHSIPLQIVYAQPAVGNDAKGEVLGITELVSVQSSFFRGSSSARMQNIKTSASRFHGLLVPPWSTFSMAAVMGDVSLDTGYSEALIIYGGRTIKGVGGGVCQVSTTLFRTVFFGGYPIEERHPHAYRVGYYEQTVNGRDNSLAGLDATVFVPMVDFKFTNDTPNWLLMETYFNPNKQKLTWKFYSTSEGRSVDWQTTGTKNVVEPPKPRYEENPDLAKGQIKQVDWAADGADVTVTRIVYRDGEVMFEDTFHTHYEPWQAVYEYGPGTKIPKDKKSN
jgi:vancomycin resistance protein YoaR